MAMSRQSLPPVNKYTGSYTEDVDGDGVRLNAFGHDDASIAYDPLSANRRFPGAADLAVLGTLVFAGSGRDTDCPSMNVSGVMGWSGSPAGGSLTSGTARLSPYGWTWLWLAGLARSCATRILLRTARNMRHYGGSSRRRWKDYS